MQRDARREEGQGSHPGSHVSGEIGDDHLAEFGGGTRGKASERCPPLQKTGGRTLNGPTISLP